MLLTHWQTAWWKSCLTQTFIKAIKLSVFEVYLSVKLMLEMVRAVIYIQVLKTQVCMACNCGGLKLVLMWKCPGCSEPLPFMNYGGHYVLRNLQCSRNHVWVLQVVILILITLVPVYVFSFVKPCTDNFTLPNHVQLMCLCTWMGLMWSTRPCMVLVCCTLRLNHL